MLSPSWNLDLSKLHISVQNGDFSIRKWKSLYFIWSTGSSATERSMFPFCSCFHMPWTFVCLPTWAFCPRFCVFLCECVSYHSWQRWMLQTAKYGASRRLTRHQQSAGDLSMHLWGGPVQDRNEERMASNNPGQWVHKFGFTSRDIKKLTVSSLLMCVCVYQEKDVESLRTHPV